MTKWLATILTLGLLSGCGTTGLPLMPGRAVMPLSAMAAATDTKLAQQAKARLQRHFDSCDRNHDNKLTTAELDDTARAMDKNKDGSVTLEEMTSKDEINKLVRTLKSNAQACMKLDKDGDKLLTLDELEGASQRLSIASCEDYLAKTTYRNGLPKLKSFYQKMGKKSGLSLAELESMLGAILEKGLNVELVDKAASPDKTT